MEGRNYNQNDNGYNNSYNGNYDNSGYNNNYNSYSGSYNNNNYSSYNGYNAGNSNANNDYMNNSYDNNNYMNNSYNNGNGNYMNNNSYNNGNNGYSYNNGGNGGYGNGNYGNNNYNDYTRNNMNGSYQGGFNSYGGNDYNTGYNNVYSGSYSTSSVNEDIKSQIIMRSFIVMLVSLLVTGIVSVIVAGNETLFNNMILNDSFYIWFLAEIGVVIGAQYAIRKRNITLAGVLYFAYAAMNGITFSVIFYVFQLESIESVLFITALLFGMMAAIGYVTKKDLSSVGSIGMMLLLGVILVSIVNMLILHSSGLDLFMDYVVVFIFVGLTAYDTQKMKRVAATASESEINVLALYCGFELYLDFLNLFIRLLSIMGKRRR